MTKRTHWGKHHLRGRVKTAHFEVADLSYNAGRWSEAKRRPLTTLLYNEKGYVVKELLYDLDGYVSQVGSKKYDAHDNKREVLFQNPRGGLLSCRVYECDEAGKLLECVSTQAHGLIVKQRCRPRYDPAGRKVEANWFFEDGTPSYKYVYRYRATGELEQQVLYKYDDEGSIEEKWITLYDEKGNVVEAACFDPQGRTIAGPTWYKYDDAGYEIEAATRDLRGDLYSTTCYSYDFDDQRNWIKRLEIFRTAQSGFETRLVTYRRLEYY
jgi:hypothetical protein